MNALNLANDNHGSSAAHGSNIPASDEASPWSNQAGALLYIETAIPMANYADQSAPQGKFLMPSSEDLTDAKIEAAEARTDAKIGRMEGKLELVVSKIDGINSRLDDIRNGINSRLDDVRNDYRATRANIWVVGLGLAVLIVAVAALFPVFFGVGTQIRDIIDKAIETHVSSPTLLPPRR